MPPIDPLQHLGLVRAVVFPLANKYYWIPQDDLLSEGTIALIKAARKFNPDMGYRFSTYAMPVIRFEVIKYVERVEHGGIRVPHNKLEKGYKPIRVSSLDLLTGDRIPAPSPDLFTAEDLKWAIAQLPPEDQQLIHLIHHDGLTQIEAAKRMGYRVPSNNGASRKVKKVYRKLRRLLGENYLQEVA